VAFVASFAIMFYYDDHEPAHFHIRGAEFRGKIALDDLSVIEGTGRLRPRELARLRSWLGLTMPSFVPTGTGRFGRSRW
jgi:hypothetical protein